MDIYYKIIPNSSENQYFRLPNMEKIILFFKNDEDGNYIFFENRRIKYCKRDYIEYYNLKPLEAYSLLFNKKLKEKFLNAIEMLLFDVESIDKSFKSDLYLHYTSNDLLEMKRIEKYLYKLKKLKNKLEGN